MTFLKDNMCPDNEQKHNFDCKQLNWKKIKMMDILDKHFVYVC